MNKPATRPVKVCGHASDLGIWHTDPKCRYASWHLMRARALNMVTLARDLAASGTGPCPVCAYAPVLAALSEHNSGPGWHSLTCQAVHDPQQSCRRCVALAEYAVGAGALCATTTGGVVVLLPGAVNDRDERDYTLPRMRLAMHSTQIGNLPTIGAKTWDVAAQLLTTAPPTTLSDALAAGAAATALPVTP